MESFTKYQLLNQLANKLKQINEYRSDIYSWAKYPEDYLSASSFNSTANILYNDADKLVDKILKYDKNKNKQHNNRNWL